MIGRARPGKKRSSSDATTLPPSSGSTGIRLKAPIATPAHHTAAAAGEPPRLAGSSGLTPISGEHGQPGGDVGDGAGQGDRRLVPRDSGCGAWYDAYPARKSSEISACAPARRAATA